MSRRYSKSAARNFQAEIVRARTRGAAAKPPQNAVERPISPQQSLQQYAQPQPALPATYSGSFTGSVYSGANHSPLDYYRPKPPSGGGAASGAAAGVVSAQSASTGPVAFAPGDPIRPAGGIDDGYGGPRQWAYPTGVNITTYPRQTEGNGFAQLRNLAELYEGVQLCESVIFRIFDRLELQIVPHLDYLRADEPETDDKWLTPARSMRDWLMQPHRSFDLHAWCKAVMRELLELDACGIYYETTRGGGLYGLRVVAGDTLVRLADTTGAPPPEGYPAYLQVVNGTPAWLGDVGMLGYLAINSRAGSLYGRPPVEQIVYRVNQALRKEHWDLTHYTDGSTPEGLLETDNPALLQASADDMEEFERLFNGMLAGNDALRVRTKTVPPGWHWKPTKQSETTTALDQYLLNLTAAAYGLTMDELGFTATSNRSTGSTQEDVVYRNAVRPYTDFIARFLNTVIRRFDGTPIAANAATTSRPGSATKAAAGTWDARFVVRWGGIEEPYDWNQRAYALSGLASKGIISPTQVKHLLHIPILPGEKQVPAMLLAPAGADSVVFPEDLVAQRDQINAAHVASLQAKTTGASQQTDAADKQGQLQDLQIQQGQLQLKASQQQMDQAAEQHQTQQQAAKQQIKQQAQAPQVPQGQPGARPAGPPHQPTQPGTAPKQQPAQAQGQRQGAQRGLGIGDQPRGAALPPLGEPGARGSGPLRGDGRDDLGAAAPAHPSNFVVRARGGEPASGGGTAGDSGIGGFARPALYAGAEPRRVTSPADRAGSGGDPAASSPVFAVASRSGESAAGSLAARWAEPAEDRGSGGGGSADGDLRGEWRAWRERSLRAVKRGERIPGFVPVHIPQIEHTWVAARLASANDAEAVRAIFEQARSLTADDPTGARDAAAEAAHDGIMVAIMVPPEQSRQLADLAQQGLAAVGDYGASAIPANDMHITLAFLGNTTDDGWTPALAGKLRRAVQSAVEDEPPFDVTARTVGRFSGDGSKPEAIHAQIEGDALRKFRARLVDRLKAQGLPVDDTFPDYKPHITLLYVDPNAPTPAALSDMAPVTIPVRAATVAVADDHSDHRLGSEQGLDRAAQGDPLDALARALTERLAAQQQQELRALKAEVSTVLGR